jgi:hypothetical protein
MSGVDAVSTFSKLLPLGFVLGVRKIACSVHCDSALTFCILALVELMGV